MKCNRCNYDSNSVYEDIVQAEQVLHIQEYYCPGCKSCLIQTYAQEGIVKSEWIDFNGK